MIDLIKSPVSEVTKKYVNLPADFLRHNMMFIFQSSKLFFSFFVSVIEKRQEISTFFTYHPYKNEWLLDKFCFKCHNSCQHHILMAYYFDQFGKHISIFHTSYNFLLRQKWHWNGFGMDLEHMKHLKFNCVLNWLHLRLWCSANSALVRKVAEQ